MKKFKAKNENEKLHNAKDFEVLFLEYLEVMDEFDVAVRNSMSRMKQLRYVVDQGMDEHPEVCRRVYREYEAIKKRRIKKKV